MTTSSILWQIANDERHCLYRYNSHSQHEQHGCSGLEQQKIEWYANVSSNIQCSTLLVAYLRHMCIEAEHKFEAQCLAVESCMLNADVRRLTVNWSLLSSVKAFTSCILSLSSSRPLTASSTVLVILRDPLPSLARPNNFSALPH